MSKLQEDDPWLTDQLLVNRGVSETELITSYLLAVGQLSIMYKHTHICMILDFNKRNLVWFSDDKGEQSSS